MPLIFRVASYQLWDILYICVCETREHSPCNRLTLRAGRSRFRFSIPSSVKKSLLQSVHTSCGTHWVVGVAFPARKVAKVWADDSCQLMSGSVPPLPHIPPGFHKDSCYFTQVRYWFLKTVSCGSWIHSTPSLPLCLISNLIMCCHLGLHFQSYLFL